MACKIENGCSPSAFCDQGKCVHAQSGLLHNRAHKFSTTSLTVPRFEVVVPTPGGGGWTFYKKGATELYMIRFDKSGAMTKHLSVASGHEITARAGRWMADNKLMVLLRKASSSNSLARAYLLVYDGSAKYLWQANYPVGEKTSHTWGARGDASEILTYADKTLGLVGGLQWLAGWHSPQVIRIQGNGKLIWRTYVDSDKATNLTATDGLSFQDGATVVAGSKWLGKGARDGMLAKVDNAGKTMWIKSYDGGGDERALQLVNSSSGGFLLAGTGTPGGKPGWWWAETDKAGKLLWQKHGNLAGGLTIQNVALAAGGLLTVSATQDVGIVKQGVLAGFDASGKQQWSQIVKTEPSTWLSGHRSMVHTDDGGLLLVGGATVWGAPNPIVVRASPWGHSTCKIAGKCAGLAAKDCSDGKPCTADLCDPAKGCAPAALADATPCGDGKSCKTGQCK